MPVENRVDEADRNIWLYPGPVAAASCVVIPAVWLALAYRNCLVAVLNRLVISLFFAVDIAAVAV